MNRATVAKMGNRVDDIVPVIEGLLVNRYYSPFHVIKN